MALMQLPDFDTFAQQARAEGFDEVIERRWDPLTVLETHTHPFARSEEHTSELQSQ